MGQNKTIDGRVGDPSKSTRDGREKELQYERHVMIGGYENPVQTMPSGEGNFIFETSDPGAIDSFYAPDADRLLRHIYRELGTVDIVRMRGYTWSVEDSENIYGTISEIGGRKPSLFGCLAASNENPSEHQIGDCRAKIVVVYHVTEASQ
jgi:hypothetical protein